MSSFLELIIEVVLRGVIAQPVIFAMWLISGRKKSYKEYWHETDIDGAACCGVLAIVGLVLICVGFTKCKTSSSKDLQGYWIVPGDPVVTIVIEKDSVYYPDTEPGIKHRYKKVGDKLIVEDEDGSDTIVYKKSAADTLWLRWPYAETATLLVRNK